MAFFPWPPWSNVKLDFLLSFPQISSNSRGKKIPSRKRAAENHFKVSLTDDEELVSHLRATHGDGVKLGYPKNSHGVFVGKGDDKPRSFLLISAIFSDKPIKLCKIRALQTHVCQWAYLLNETRSQSYKYIYIHTLHKVGFWFLLRTSVTPTPTRFRLCIFWGLNLNTL